MKKLVLLALSAAAFQLTGCSSGGVDTPTPTGSGGESNFVIASSSSPDNDALNDGVGQNLSSQSVSSSSSIDIGASEVPGGEPVIGKALYESGDMGCMDCHGASGQDTAGAPGPIDPNKELFSAPASVTGEQAKAQYTLGQYIAAFMPPSPTGPKCSQSCADNIAAYIKSWKEDSSSSTATVSSASSVSSQVVSSSVAPVSSASQVPVSSSSQVLVQSSSAVSSVSVSSSSVVSSTSSQASSVSSEQVSSSVSSSDVPQSSSSSSSSSEESSSSEAVSSESSSVSSEVAAGDPVNGKELYDNGGYNCVLCHGPTGGSQTRPIDPTREFYKKTGDDAEYELAEYITNFMPSPGKCNEECGLDIAAYIRTWAEDSSSSESSSSESSEASSSEDSISSSEESSSEETSSSEESSVAESSSSSEAPVVSSSVESSSSSSVESSVEASSESSQASESSEASSESSEAYEGDPVAGKTAYENTTNGCVQCHGATGQIDIYKAIDPTRDFYEHSSSNVQYTLENYISQFMPIGGGCTGTCAADIAAYIRSWVNDEESSSSSEASSSAATAETVDGLEYYFSMNQGSGTELVDVLGNADNGQISGAAWVNGLDETGLEFDGGGVVNFDSVNIDSSQITISAWIKPNSDGENREGRIISKAAGFNEDDHIWMLSFGKRGDDTVYLRFRLRSDTVDTKTIWSNGGEVQMGVWQHVAVTYDGDVVTMYLNGDVIGSDDIVIGDVASNPEMPVGIGGHPGGGRGYDGVIDEVRIYSRSLSQQDVQNEHAGLFDQISQADPSTGSGSSSGGSSEPEPIVVPDVILPIIEQEFKPKYSCNNSDNRGTSQDLYRRLSHQELINALTTLFGEDLMATAATERSLLPEETHHFEAEVFASALTSSHLNAINSMAGKLASGAAEDATFIGRFTNCGALDTTDCVEQMVENFGARALRRPLSQEEVDYYVNLYVSDDEITAATLIHSLLLDVEFNLIVEKGDADGSRYRLSAFEVASRISFRTTANIPDDQLWQAALNGELETLEQVRAQANRLFATDMGKQYIRSFFRSWVEVEDSAELAVTDAYKDGINVDELYADALNDFDQFIDHVVWDINGSLHDLFHDTSVFPQTDTLAAIYGTGLWSGDAPLSTSTGHKGLLMRPATLIGGGNHTSIILRGVMVRRRLLCDTLPTPSQDVVNARDDSADASALDHEIHPNRDVIKNLTASDTCMGCHALINPLAFALENFDSLGRFQTIEPVYDDSDDLVASHVVSTVSYYPEIEQGGTNALMDGDDLALALTTSSKLKSCFATQLHRFQRFKQIEQSDHCGLNETESFIASGEGSILDVLIMNVANDDIFWRGN